MKLAFALLVCLSTTAFAQIGSPPDSPLTYGQALAHQHPSQVTVTAFYCGHGLIPDPANDPGNIFLGNTICIVTYDNEWLYYNWSPVSDPDAAVKLAMLEFGGFNGLVTVRYDPWCKMVTYVQPNGWLP